MVYGTIDEVRVVETPDYFLKMRNYLARRIRTNLSDRTAGLGLAYLLGEKFMLDEDLIKAFNKSGLSHVIVASGFALSVLVMMVARIFRNHSKFAMTSFSLLTMFLFLSFTGFTSSMTRAFLMSSLSMLVGYTGREFRSLRLIILVACLSLIFEPGNFWSVGWQLSFTAFFGVSVLAPILMRYFFGEDKNALAQLLLTSLAAQFCCLPISIYYFGAFSLAGVATNLILPPLLGMTMLSVFLTGIFGGLIANWTEALLNFHIQVAELAARQTWLQMEFASGEERIFLLFFLVVAVTLCLWRRTKYDKIRLLNVEVMEESYGK